MTKRRGVKRNLKKTKRRYKKNLGKTKRRYMSKKGGGGDDAINVSSDGNDNNDVAPSLHKHYVLKDNKIILDIVKELFDDCKFIKNRKMSDSDRMRLNRDCGLNISPLFYNLDFQKELLEETLEDSLNNNEIKYFQITFEPPMYEKQLTRFEIAISNNNFIFLGTSLNTVFNKKLEELLIKYDINTSTEEMP